jgi:replicative DNA helicase
MIDTTDHEREIIRSVMMMRTGHEKYFNLLQSEYFTSPERVEIFSIVSILGYVPASTVLKNSKLPKTREEITICENSTAGKDQDIKISLLKDAYLRRLLSETIHSTQNRLPSILDPLQEQIEALEESIRNIKNIKNSDSEKKARSAVEIIPSMINWLSDIIQNPNGNLIFSGMDFIDDAFGATIAGDYTVIGARPSVGKSAFALQIALHNAIKVKKNVLICSLEMSAESLMARAICSKAGVSLGRFLSGKGSTADFNNFGKSVDEYKIENLFIRDVPRDKPSSIETEINRVQDKIGKKLDILIIDHIHIAGSDGKHNGRLETLTEISGEYKRFASKYELSLFALAQLSKANAQQNNRSPTLADLRECGAIEQDATNVILLHRMNANGLRQEEEPMEIILAKARNSAVGAIPATFVGKSMTFKHDPNERDSKQNRDLEW